VTNLAATRVRQAGRERRAFARWFGRGDDFTELATRWRFDPGEVPPGGP